MDKLQTDYRWTRIQNLFNDAADLPMLEWEAHLRARTADDETLFFEVMAMLKEDILRVSLIHKPFSDVAYALLTDLPKSFEADDFRHYRLGQFLGEGSTGAVYLAEREDLCSQVAVKILSSGTLSPARRQRFEEEQRILAQLDHPFIAKIFDADKLKDGTPWFAMEYVDGLPLTEYCFRRKCSTDEKLRLFSAVCEAVRYAHAHTIIHRDLKPSNILVKKDGVVKLLDFGIAKRLNHVSGATYRQTHSRPMTLAYASPEQIAGLELSTQSDVYALGVVLYELLSGSLPFDVSNKTELEVQKSVAELTAEPPSIVWNKRHAAFVKQIEPGKRAWRDLDVLCLTAMHRDRERRYRSAEAIIRDIEHYFKAEPLEARPDDFIYRFSKFTLRHIRILCAVAAAATIIVVLTGVFAFRLEQARRATLTEAKRTQRIETFMLNLFDGGDKTASPADSLQAVTLVDRGVHSANLLGNEPALQAELYQTLGNIYQKLGKFDDAEKLLRSAWEKRKSTGGTDNSGEAQALLALGLLKIDKDQLNEGEDLVRRALAICNRHPSPGNPTTTKASSALGRVLIERGAYSDAIKLLNQTVALQSAQNINTSDLATSITELAIAHYYSGEFALSEKLNNQALAIDESIFGRLHPRVADDLINLGEIQHDRGDDVRAERYYRQALTIKQSWYGMEHPETAITMTAVGQALIYQSRYNEAAGFLQNALSIQERFFGRVHSQVAMGLNTLALLDLRRGRLFEAEGEFTRMADIYRAIHGDRHILVGVALLNLGEVFVQEKKFSKAEASFRGALARFQEKLPAAHQSTAIAAIKLGHVLLLKGKYTEAKKNLEAGYQSLTRQQTPPAARIGAAREDLAEVYEKLHQKERAKSLRSPIAGETSNNSITLPPRH